MWKQFLIIGILGIAYSSAPTELRDDMPVVTDELVDQINNSDLPWVASKEWVGEMTIAEARALVGTEIEELTQERQENWGSLLKYTAIPASFDARAEWPTCIHPIMNQGGCGSCWAFGAVESLSDRYCIQKHINVVLSPEFMVDCDTSDGGCKGGATSRAWNFLETTGVVEESCDPYNTGKTGCITHCTDGLPLKTYKSGAWKSYSGVESIQLAILQGGPLETTFGVYNDFFSYKSGVYVYNGTAAHAGGHAVKVLGWGKENGLDYWLCANSWGSGWGDQGYFKIAFGQCGICGSAIAGDAV